MSLGKTAIRGGRGKSDRRNRKGWAFLGPWTVAFLATGYSCAAYDTNSVWLSERREGFPRGGEGAAWKRNRGRGGRKEKKRKERRRNNGGEKRRRLVAAREKAPCRASRERNHPFQTIDHVRISSPSFRFFPLPPPFLVSQSCFACTINSVRIPSLRDVSNFFLLKKKYIHLRFTLNNNTRCVSYFFFFFRGHNIVSYWSRWITVGKLKS